MYSLSEWLADGLLIAMGAALGTPARFFLSGLVARRLGETFPWGTLVVNATGCLVMGLVAWLAATRGLSSASTFWLIVATGFLGSYTTVSSFALQTRALVRDGESRLALGYVALSLFLCLGAVTVGFEFGREIFAGAAR
ncbi:fluoride efflux transporter CrcB [Reyranella sp.]|jgi:CrcB protein|uniref:fluoride efflux transporter CrcB n=1 Tax=Reyranella sp. TaxID=1929291 RepID=UPI002F937CFC